MFYNNFAYKSHKSDLNFFSNTRNYVWTGNIFY